MSEPFLDDDEEQSADGIPLWIVTFGDMMSILLTFFILLFAFSEIDASKYKGLTESLREAFGVQKTKEFLEAPKGQSLVPHQTGGSNSAASLMNQLNSILPMTMQGASLRNDEGRGVSLTLPGSILFPSGEATLNQGFQDYLRKIAQVVMEKPGLMLQVEGHTDDVPINTARFQSNWELSTTRATAVIRFLIEECGVPGERLAAAGYGDSRPVTSNDSTENREKNRRVEFRFVETPTGQSPPVGGPSPQGGLLDGTTSPGP